jgi:protein disulfide-isomerase-like protein
LTSDNFDSITSQGPWFIKFYAPWCGHCQRLAPVWEELAGLLKGQVNVGSVNCDIERALCTRFEVRGYPTLNLIVDGTVTPFNGAREIKGLEAFALRAAGNPVVDVEIGELDGLKEKHDAFFVLINDEKDNEASVVFTSVARSLFAASYYYRIPASQAGSLKLSQTPALLAIKDGDQVVYRGSLTDRVAVRAFIEHNRYSALIPLVDSNAQEILSSEYLVVLGLFAPNRVGFEQNRQELKAAALSYRRRTEAELVKPADGKQVLFAWLDATRYVNYVSRTFGVDDSELPALVIVDPQVSAD